MRNFSMTKQIQKSLLIYLKNIFNFNKQFNVNFSKYNQYLKIDNNSAKELYAKTYKEKKYDKTLFLGYLKRVKNEDLIKAISEGLSKA